MDKEKLFDEICNVENFLNLKPRKVSIGPVPVSPNNRKLYSHPKAFKMICQAMGEIIKKLDIDLIAGGETAGIPIATGISFATDIPFVYVRKGELKGKTRDLVEGDYSPGQKVVLVDDLVGKGETKKLFIKNIEDSGLKVTDIVVFWFLDAEDYKDDIAWIKEKGFGLNYLFTWQELAEAQYKRGKVPEEIYPFYLDFIKHPESWRDNKEKWQKYIEVLKKENIEIPDFLDEYLK